MRWVLHMYYHSSRRPTLNFANSSIEGWLLDLQSYRPHGWWRNFDSPPASSSHGVPGQVKIQVSRCCSFSIGVYCRHIFYRPQKAKVPPNLLGQTLKFLGLHCKHVHQKHTSNLQQEEWGHGQQARHRVGSDAPWEAPAADSGASSTRTHWSPERRSLGQGRQFPAGAPRLPSAFRTSPATPTVSHQKLSSLYLPPRVHRHAIFILNAGYLMHTTSH